MSEANPRQRPTTMKRVIRSMVRRLRRRKTPPPAPRLVQSWAIGILRGPSLHELAEIPDVVNPALTARHVTDVSATYVADPFMLELGGTWHMFFEVMNGLTGKGEIGLAVSADSRQWTYEGVVLTEAFHLSYPYVFQWNGAYFMIPETGEAKAVRLYQAQCFPREWRLEGIPICRDPRAGSSSTAGGSFASPRIAFRATVSPFTPSRWSR
jgi:hypothetical protein